MSSEKDYEKLVSEMMKKQAADEGLDPAQIDADQVRVHAQGPAINVEYAGAKVTLPAPSQGALDDWFRENGKVIAGSLVTLAGVVVGAGVAVLTNKKD